MQRVIWLAVVWSFAFVMLAAPCRAQSAEAVVAAKDSSAAGEAHPSPEVVLRKMADYLGGLPAVSCRMESEMHVQAQGLDNRIATKLTVRLDRPKRFALIVDEGMGGITAVSDGKQLVEYLPAMNRYVVRDAPEDLAALDGPGQFAGMLTGGMAGFTVPEGGDDFYQQLMTGVNSSEYLGTEKIDDVECHHCRFFQEEFDWDIWIEQGDRPVIHKVVPDLSKRFAQLGEQIRGVKIEFSLRLSDWNTAPKFTDADFTFTPPSGAEKVDSLFGGNDEEGEEPHPLLGQPAPTFKTVDLQDNEVDLGSELGKGIVILDFWATWCGPCVEALPIIADVAKKYKDRGVIFHGVNVGEDKEKISEFLKSRQLDAPVALDSDGKISELYQVDGIPQTVLIGKDGKVQVVNIGFGLELGVELRKQLDDLLAGKDLASDALAKAEKARQHQAAGEDAEHASDAADSRASEPAGAASAE